MKMEREGATSTQLKITGACHNKREAFQYVTERSCHLASTLCSQCFNFTFCGQRFLNEDKICWWEVGGRAQGCSMVWMLMNWCSNLLMRPKLSPLSGFVHMKGHLACRGRCDISLTLNKLVSVGVLVCARENVREREREKIWGSFDLRFSHLTTWAWENGTW